MADADFVWSGTVSSRPWETRQCTARAKHTGKRCRQSPSQGSNVCRYHGSLAPESRRAARWRLEVARALIDGVPHPAVVFFQMMLMRWHLSEDESTLVCEIPVDQLGGPEAARSQLGWVTHWQKVMTFVQYNAARDERARRVRRPDRESEKRSTSS